MLHIAIGIHSLCLVRGGAERVAVEMATNMLRRGHAVTLHSWGDVSGKIATPTYHLPQGVNHKVWQGKGGAAEEVAKLRTFLINSGTSVFISVQDCSAHLFWASACLGSGIPFIYSEHSVPARVETIAWNRLGRLAVMSVADVIHLLLPTYLESVPQLWRSKVRVISNAAPDYTTLACVEGEGKKTLIYLSRLDEGKRPALLVRAFALLCHRHPDWRLDIWGIGPEEPFLRRLVRKLCLEYQVRLCGLCLDPPPVYVSAQCFCLPSRMEGFPKVVLEAMSAGLPLVGMADCEAMRAIISPGVDGMLAPEATPQSLAVTLDEVMGDAALRRRLGKGALQTAKKYAPQLIYDQWEALLTEIASRKGRTVMDGFAEESFAMRAELSRLARKEWLDLAEGEAIPHSIRWLLKKIGIFARHLTKLL